LIRSWSSDQADLERDWHLTYDVLGNVLGSS
jgi:hypothetical protein